ncbi:wall-associated receptor kinase-like 3 isoform X2 [Lactuca sativa]|uniref:wall-associated receptor kinase-like 3 isoform X2 n=1 Tax=Lactuca sativa TaxID=4236 RepID=UPI000CCB7AE8|nr:wall-associated receptor kinase-like 3 isoform X2 [Lactuca sativa]
MQKFQLLHLFILISLTTKLTEAQSAIKTGCSRRCGNVWIPFPFGIGRNCSLNKWYTVDCNSSTPYLSALNHLEILRVDMYQQTVAVNGSTNIDHCKNPVQNSNLVLSGSPYRFSRLNNIFVVEGCGNGVIMHNGSIVSGCSTTCQGDTVSDRKNCFGIGCCQSTIPYDLESFTLNLTGLERRSGNQSCVSAMVVDSETYSSGIFYGQNVPISLKWIREFNRNSTGCINCERNGGVCDPSPGSISGMTCQFYGGNPTQEGTNFAQAPFYLDSGWFDACGEVLIPPPFTIGRKWSSSDWYTIDCNSSKPYLSALNNVEVLGISYERQTVTVNLPMISDCQNQVQYSNLDIRRTPYKISALANMLVVEGCGNAVIMENGNIVTGCSTTCHNDTVSDINNCFGIGCCRITLSSNDLRSFTLNMTGLERQNGNGKCGSAYFVDRKSFVEGRFSSKSVFDGYAFVPISLSWSNNLDVDAEPECRACKNNGGECHYDPGVISNMTCLHPDRTSESRRSNNSLGVILGVSISMGSLFLMVISYTLYKIIKKREAKRRKERYFKRNGGLLLKQQAASINLFDKTILFTCNELEKATDHFNENRILGRGGQGTVYKGMLTDGRIVAIKKSKVVSESQLKQFINEVVILSQVNHRNVVRLLGCCLETEVPLLVSEFISNGTLYEFIQDETNEFATSLKMRLQIAREVAGALSYLHSSSSIPIYHRDIKTTNILLDEKYKAKISDFGTSRFVSIDDTHLTTLVKGTFGYLDPEYFQSSQFTEKSDVYSFGVVLLELLTREKPISLTRFGDNRSLATHFVVAMEEGRILSILDEMNVKEGSMSELLSIANLALRCLNLNGKNRPTMKEVVIELEGMRLSHVSSTVPNNFVHMKYGEQVKQIYVGSTSTSLTFDDDLCR